MMGGRRGSSGRADGQADSMGGREERGWRTDYSFPFPFVSSYTVSGGLIPRDVRTAVVDFLLYASESRLQTTFPLPFPLPHTPTG